jgi:hypothetical protein
MAYLEMPHAFHPHALSPYAFYTHPCAKPQAGKLHAIPFVLSCMRYPLAVRMMLGPLLIKCPLSVADTKLPCMGLEGDTTYITVNLPYTSHR